MDIHEAKDIIEKGVVGGGMLPKLNNCIAAMENGVSRVHILDGRLQHCLLLEFFTQKGIGTAILKEPILGCMAEYNKASNNKIVNYKTVYMTMVDSHL